MEIRFKNVFVFSRYIRNLKIISVLCKLFSQYGAKWRRFSGRVVLGSLKREKMP